MPISPYQRGKGMRGAPPKADTVDWAPDFLDRIRSGWTVVNAAAYAKVSPGRVYARRKTDSEFRACWEEAAEICTEHLEQEAQRRAYHGTERPVFYKGERCGEVQEYSDSLLMFMLRARKPEVYREKEPKGSTVIQGDVNIQANMVAAQAIREMIANGELGTADFTVDEVRDQEVQAPAVPGALDDGGQWREVGAGAAPDEDQPDIGGWVADPEQPDGGDGPVPAR